MQSNVANLKLINLIFYAVHNVRHGTPLDLRCVAPSSKQRLN
jgi:hypothetical protein